MQTANMLIVDRVNGTHVVTHRRRKAGFITQVRQGGRNIATLYARRAADARRVHRQALDLEERIALALEVVQ